LRTYIRGRVGDFIEISFLKGFSLKIITSIHAKKDHSASFN
ncbi:unnamed protein product, partial [marine sediment metagenome]